MDHLTDAELMSRTRSGDREAFSRIIHRHQDAMINYLTRLAGCRARAEEMAQETFLRLYLLRDRYSEQGRLEGLLFRIATNLAISEIRRCRRQRLLHLLLPWGTNGQAAEPTPQGQLLQREEHRLLTEAIKTMPLRCRLPLVLHEIQGMSYQEVARVLGVAENTVKSRISRGRKLLRRRLAPVLNGEAP